MNTKFLDYMLEGCSFPAEAADFFRSLTASVKEQGLEDEFDEICKFYMVEYRREATEEMLKKFAEKAGGSFYSYWMLLFLLNAEEAREKYYARGVSEEIFLDTFCDLRYKAIECMEEHGVWGTFVAGWYGLFYSCRIIKFGRFEYQDEEYGWRDLDLCGYELRGGRKCLSLHIPSSGEPFDYEARLESYKTAYEFYKKEHGEGPLVCICGSWLLNPGYENVFPEGSNTRDFQKDFYMLKGEEQDEFHDDWRVFGRHHRKPLEELPEDTRMRRAFKKYFLEGGKPGEGFGVIIYDDQGLRTRRQ